MTIKLPVDVNTLDDETLSLLIDESQKALDERKKYMPFVGEIIEVWDNDGPPPNKCSKTRFMEFTNVEYPVKAMNGIHWRNYRRLDPTSILQFRDHEPGPCPCPDEEWVHVMLSNGEIITRMTKGLDWGSKTDIIRWCPAVGVE